jgi:hypothetical protein
MKKIIKLTESQLNKIVKKVITELYNEKDDYLKYLDTHKTSFGTEELKSEPNLTKENLENYIGCVFIPKVYIKDVFTDEPIGKGNRYKLRKVFEGYASFDDLDDRGADSYKFNKQPIVKVYIDDVLEKMRLEENNKKPESEDI